MHRAGEYPQDKGKADGPDFLSWSEVKAEFETEDSIILRAEFKWARRIFELINRSKKLTEVAVLSVLTLIALTAISHDNTATASLSVICITFFGSACTLPKIIREASYGEQDTGQSADQSGAPIQAEGEDRAH